MIEEYEKRKRKQISFMKSLLDYGMGMLIFIAGIFFLFRQQISAELNEKFPPTDLDKVFGGLCILYGAWRIYRGFKKNYFR